MQNEKKKIIESIIRVFSVILHPTESRFHSLNVSLEIGHVWYMIQRKFSLVIPFFPLNCRWGHEKPKKNSRFLLRKKQACHHTHI